VLFSERLLEFGHLESHDCSQFEHADPWVILTAFYFVGGCWQGVVVYGGQRGYRLAVFRDCPRGDSCCLATAFGPGLLWFNPFRDAEWNPLANILSWRFAWEIPLGAVVCAFSPATVYQF